MGTTIATSFRVLPLLPVRARWIARIIEFEWNRYFADVQATGPFKSWHHRHEFEAAIQQGTGGTLIRDVIDYEVGLGIIGSMANALFVRRQIAGVFAERQRKIADLLR